MNVKLADIQLKKLKADVKNKTATTLRMNLKMLEGNDLPHQLLLTTRQKTKLRNAFSNNMSTNLKLSKAQISKIIQSGGFLGSLLSKLAGPLMKVAIPVAKKSFSPIISNSSCSSNLCRNSKENTRFWNNDFNNFKQRNHWHNENCSSYWRFQYFVEEITKRIKNESKEQQGGFLSMLLGTLGASLLENLLAGKGIVKAGSGNKKGKGIVTAGTRKNWDFKYGLIL